MFHYLQSRPANATPPLRLRVISAVLVALVALLMYDAANALTAWRGATRCLAFPWELHLPRLTWFVVPYLSIDILLAVSPLFALRFDEWRTLLLRLFWVFSFSCLVFIFFPCRCGYPRSIPDDWTAPLFQLLHFTDLPFNQAPSLHISEAIITAPVILARIKSATARASLIAWYILGSAGTILTYQHHVMDVLTGAAVGFAIIKLIPRR